MEVTNKNFWEVLPYIEACISEADFVAVDTELTGVEGWSESRKYELPEQRFKKMKASIESYIIVQFGMVTFKWIPEKGSYSCVPFNFYVIPVNDSFNALRQFTFTSGSLQFQRQHKVFDFNKWAYEGIGYLNRKEEEQYLKDFPAPKQIELPKIQTPLSFEDKLKPVVEKAIMQVSEWLDGSSTEYLDIHPDSKGDFIIRVLIEQILLKFPEKVYCEKLGSFPSQFLRVHQWNDEKRASLFIEKTKEHQVYFFLENMLFPPFKKKKKNLGESSERSWLSKSD